MEGLPWHPVAVHLPLGLAGVWPLACVAVLLALRVGWLPARAWWGVVALAALLAGGALVAVETGESDHDRVEERVGHDLVEAHEEAGERVLWLAAAGLVASLAGAGLRARAGATARWLTLALSLAVLAAALQAGHLGGRLVYVHGAASVWMEPPAGGGHEHGTSEPRH